LSGLLLREALGERRFTAEDFPIAVGGEGAAVVMAGRPPGAQAYVGLHEEQLFVQPAEGAEVLHNGEPVTRSTWLRPGDVVNFGAARLRLTANEDGPVIEVEDGAADNITVPPVIEPGARLRGAGDAEAERIDAAQFRPTQPTRARRSFSLSPMRLALGALAVAAAFVLWFVFTATSISVRTEPAEARVTVEGSTFSVRLGERVLLRPGEYRFRAQLPGYEPAQLEARVTAEPNQRFELKLAKLPGRLRIDAPEGAVVSVDGETLGATPGEFELPAGRHTVSIAAQRYQPFSAQVEVEGGGKVQTLTPQLTPNWADVSITSQPTGAELLVNGERRGVTPLTTQIVAGNHPIELRLEGFKPWSTDIQVKANEPQTIGPVQLGLPDAQLTLRSEPADANVSVAGVYRGRTPLTLELKPDMTHAVVLTRPGYEAATRELKLAPGEQRSLSVPLTGVYGEVTVRAQPADAQVFVNGKASGAANQTLRLVATTHEITVRKSGYVDYTATVTPRPGVPQVVEATLLTPAQARLAQTPATIRTKADQELRLMPLGRFVMGSPRREPGRRANEAQREVELRRPFYIGVTEVTNAQFRRFRPQHRSGIAGQHTLDLDNQPVVGVSWQDAAAFCNWLSEQEGLEPAYEKKGDALVAVNPLTNGYRLPTDAEWEWVARRERSGALRRYPWGDTLPVAAASGNYADASARLLVTNVVPDYDDGFAAAAPVAKFPPSALGLHDLGGNVAEWVHDLYTVSMDAREVAVDPTGPAEGRQHVIRGSSWRSSSVTDLRLAARDFGDSARDDVGFRIARYAH
jgi:formylglycine-generating enzyme required for sulfatase activity